MTLDPGYLEYPLRRRGMDHPFYPYSNLFERKPLAWRHRRGVAIALVVNLEWFPILPQDKPFRAPGHMATPYPDYRHYTSRDYGNRVGVFRLLEAFTAVGARASFATNAAILERYPELVAAIQAAGHEIVAHSTDMNGTIASGMDPGAERALITQTLATFADCGIRPQGWMSIARSQSFETPALLAERGLRYMADWVNDELPYAFATPLGPLVNVPVNHELSDRQVITVQQNSADSYCEQLRDAYALLAGEAAQFGGRMLPIQLTPYISGLPYRVTAIEKLLKWLAAQPQAAFATLGEIANDFSTDDLSD